MAYNPEEDIKVADLPEKTTDVVSDDKLLVIDSEDANILKQVDASKVGGGGGGSGYTKAETDALLNAKQDTLESGTNIKTINGQDILGPGNIVIQGGGTVTIDDTLSATSENPVQNKIITNALNGKADTSAIPDVSNLATKTELQAKQDTLVSGTNIKTINNTSILGNGNIDIQGGTGAQQPIADIQETNQVETLFQIYSKKGNIQPRFIKVDYQVREYYPISNPTREKVHYGIGLLTMKYGNEETTTNPSDWRFSCVYDGVKYNDCFVYLGYDENNRQGGGGYIKRIPSSIDTNTKQVTCIRNEGGNLSNSYGKTETYFITKIA